MMRSRYLFVLAILGLWLGTVGCPGKAQEKGQDEKAGGRPAVAVDVMQISALDLTEGIDAVGSLSPKFEARVKSEYAGVVTDVYVTEWVKVKKGAPLARIDTREAEILLDKARAEIEEAKAKLLQAEVGGNRAERERERAERLKEVGLITRQNFDDALTEREAAAARIAAAKAQLSTAEKQFRHFETRLSKATILAPMDGVVALKDVNVGDLVGEAGSSRILFRIVDNRLLDLTMTVPSNEMDRLRLGQSVLFSTDALPGKAFTARVKFINPAVSEADRSVKIVAEVENEPELLKGGLFVKGRIITGERKGVLQVPRPSLLTWDVAAKKGELFVIEKEIAHRRTVQTGSVSGESVEIVSGLSASEEVVTRGGFNLKEGDRVKINQKDRGA
jgi:RND family efflux transporter MFP subunit